MTDEKSGTMADHSFRSIVGDAGGFNPCIIRSGAYLHADRNCEGVGNGTFTVSPSLPI